jgi:hypothetical protein
LQSVDPTQALIYYGRKEAERTYALTCAALFYANPIKELAEEYKPELEKLNPAELGRKMYASIPSSESTNKDYVHEFIELAVPQLVQFAAKVTRRSEANVLADDEVFNLIVTILEGMRPVLKTLCIVRSLQRENRQPVNVDEVIANQQAAGEAFKAAIERKNLTLTLTEKNEDLERIWNLFDASLETEVAELIADNRAEIRQHVSRCVCLIN